ncbi:ankycorbin-like isoform X1 [Littorina saxatilis]|uniref:Uncharacterized protein n=1 Tax=Littorina saxatilis TaxID=31220 RepID=A0AAN9GRL9_9CAEN
MSSKRVRNLFNKFGRTKSRSTTDLSEWSKSDEKLMKAVEAQDAKKVSSILSKKPMVPAKLGPRGHSIFHVACALGNPQIVELLLKETDDVNDLTIQGNTCLQLAAAKGHEQVVQRLMQSGAEIDMRDSNDMTALHHACAGLHYGSVHALLQGGSDPRCVEKGGKTPLFYAAHRGEIAICKLLVDKGADVNAGDKMHITPLMVAAKEGKREACEFLLKRGANPNTADREGHMALFYAMSSGHSELREVFANAPTHASWGLSNTDPGASKQAEEEEEGESTLVAQSQLSSSSQVDTVTNFTHDASPPTLRPADAVRSLASSDAETISQSEDESPNLRSRASDPTGLSSGRMSPLVKDTPAYKELEAEHEQLSEEYHTLSIENLRLRDKLDFLQQRMNGKHEQGNGAKEVSKEVQHEIRNLKNLLEEEKERCKELESHLAVKATEGAEVSKDPDSWHDSDDEELFDSQGKKTKDGKDVNDKQMVALLRSQILSLRQENDQLRNNAQALHNGYHESSQHKAGEGEEGKAGSNMTDPERRISTLEAEKHELKAELLKLKESATSQELSGALGQEELLLNNSKLELEMQGLRSAVEALEGEKKALQQTVTGLEEEKAAIPSDKVAVLNSAKVMEEVTFDSEGFVEGQDMTKEEFLQAQNDQLKEQCRLLTDELTKLRGTFDAILKAGDTLQSDYDQLQAEKDRIHDELDVLATEKNDMAKENEFLLSDGNAMHEDLKKLVQELEKLQEKYRKVCTEKDQLQHQQDAVNIAGKVGEVARLLEEREKMQGRLSEAEDTAAKLTHDQAILLEEVQSLQDSVASLTTERDALHAEVEDAEALVSQHEALTLEYAQLEIDFNELLKDKEILEADLQGGEGSEGLSRRISESSPDMKVIVEERDLLITERDQLELTIKELSHENALLEEELESLRTRLAKDGGGNGSHIGGSVQLEMTVRQLSKENAELEEELANAQEQISELEAQLEDTKAAASEDSDVEALRAGITQLEATVTELSQENADLEDELTSVKGQLEENRQLLEGTGSSASDSTVQKLKAENWKLESKVEELERKVAESRQNGDLEPSSTTLNNNIKEEDRLLLAVEELEREKTALKSQLDSVQKRLALLEGGSGEEAVNGIADNGDTGSVISKSSKETEKMGRLKEQVDRLHQELAETEQIHTDTVNTYRTHLLSAVQGHMDPDVKEALHSIIEMRSMEQFC